MKNKGTVGVLNVGAGDTKLSFDKSNPAERIRAARIVKDMLRRGYALLVEVERDGVKSYTRALDFDEDVCEYIIADGPDPYQAKEDDPAPKIPAVTEPVPKPVKREKGRRRIPADETRSVAVARIAGG